ncbi:MAG: hypothetical protein ACYCXT_10780 [Acidiferrobacteraceae bacterium]
MSHRDETFRRMLGHEPGQTEQADIAMLQEAARISDNDPFWGIAAFLYARNPSDVENRERLKVTLASLEGFGRTIEGFGRTLEEAVARLPDGSAGTAVTRDELASTVETAMGRALAEWAPRSSLRDWLGDHVNAVLATAGGLVITVLLAVVVACWAGYGIAHRDDAARQAVRDANARTVAAWIRTPEGQWVYAWARLNAVSLRPLLSCAYPGWRRISQDGYTVCYPNGSGHGYYLASR